MSAGLCLAVTLSAWLPVWADVPTELGSLETRAVLRAGQVVQGDYFALGPHVEISGTVNGDLYAAGGDVLIDGAVNGDVIVAGGKITLSGSVSQDARLAAGQVTISGTVGRNITVGGGDVQLTESAQVRENLLAGGGNVQLAGHIGRDARVGAGHVTISNGIDRDLAVAAASVRLTSKATVGGKLRYWSESAPSIDEGATVRGGVVQRPLPEGWRGDRVRHGFAGARFAWAGISFVSTLILGLVLLRIYPVFCRNAAGTIQARPGASLAVGGALVVGVPLVVLLCIVTLVGIPIGLLLGLLYVPTLYLARVFVMFWAGGLLLKRVSGSSSLGWAFVAGLVLYALLSLIPFVGKFVTLATLLLGVGALLITKKELVATLREQQQV